MKKHKTSGAASSGSTFDPFHDRVSRDIRNSLSEAFVEAWQGGAAAYEATAQKLRQRHAQPAYRNYIDRRVANYRRADEEHQKLGEPDLMEELIVLWNRKLFFEVHELLESHWLEARGERREVLKTLIQAAAVYVHREAGRLAAAEKMGRRVSGRLDDLRVHLGAIRNLDDLRKALADPQEPPRLKGRLR